MNPSTSKPEIQISGLNRAKVNEPFVKGLRRLHGKGSILEGIPRGGMTLVHPASDKDSSFDGGGKYDFTFRPSQDAGYYDVLFTPGLAHLLKEDGAKIKAVVLT